MSKTSNSKTIGSFLNECPFRGGANPAIQFKSGGEWKKQSWVEYHNSIKYFAAYLKKIGVKADEKIAILSNSRYEWAIADFASLGLQAVVVPIYANNTVEDIEYILKDCEAKFLILENRSLYKKLSPFLAGQSQIQKVISFEKVFDSNEIEYFEQCLKVGKDFADSQENFFFESCEALKLTDIATILYTSGTTGRPKGVVLTHQQIVSEVGEAFPLCGATAEDVTLSFLPYAHILGRIELWGHMYIGYCISFAESLEKLRDNLKEIRPTFLMSVPRIFEKVYTSIWSQAEANPIKRKLFHWAVDVGLKVGDKKLSHQALPLPLLAEYELAHKLVLSKIESAFGGRLRFAISGGAPLGREIALFFHACGILILEGYGLTETTAAVCVNTPFNYRFGSVGRPIGDVQIKIAEDGEVLLRSKKIMKEYFKNPQATSEVLKDGWFYTGDIGEILSGGDLKITDRKKDLIKTAGGKYVAPQKIEALLKPHPLIAFSHIHGDQKKYVVAVLSLDRLQVEQFARDHGISFQVWTEILKLSSLQDKVRKIIAEVNAQLASYESIKKFWIAPVEFSIEGGELTPSLKLKRRVLDQRYQKEIEALYD